MAYHMLGAAGEIIAEWEYVYLLRRTDRLRMTLTIADAEIAAWAARKA